MIQKANAGELETQMGTNSASRGMTLVVNLTKCLRSMGEFRMESVGSEDVRKKRGDE